MTAICDICEACHDPRCPMGMFHEPDCCGLAIWIEWLGGVFCLDCAEELVEMERRQSEREPKSLPRFEP